MAKQRTLKTVLAGMAPERRARVQARANKIAHKYYGLQELRKARAKTQVEIAATLAVSQPYVAKLEQRSDLMLSVLRKYVRSMGGELELAVTFPDSGRVVIEGLGETDENDELPAPHMVTKRGDRPRPGR
jgi:transcriptional regulator with XRE-family HTH domain